MCGISGLLSQKNITPREFAQASAASQTLNHRGPDGAGEYRDAQVALGVRRLAIIDLKGGGQPLYNEDRKLVLVANGEIYNHLELRRRLESRGHRFNTGSDCETILHAYEEHGVECVVQLRGMFAFALWDSERRRLVLARDRFGEKPLYLYEPEGQLLFASELKALLRSGLVPFELDPKAIDLYFHYQYVPEPGTPLKNVRKLDAAHLLILDVDPWRKTETCYWRMEDAPPLEGDAPLLIREQLETVSELVMGADVPVGVALSSGLDSSAIAALANLKRPGSLQAFTVGYTGRPESDERAAAQKLTQDLGLPFHEGEIDTAEVAAFFPELNYWRDDPVADISGHGYYALMRLARACNVPVMLQGQGGDELFWGYEQLRQAALESLLKDELHRSFLRAPFQYFSIDRPRDLSRAALSRWGRDFGGMRAGWQCWQRHRSSPAERMVFYDRSPDFQMAVNETAAIYGSQFLEQLKERDATELFTFPRPWPRVDLTLTRLVSETYLRENGIAQGDRLSMASSVEMRLPLVDYKLVETVIGLRRMQTDVRLPPKFWLREAVKDVLPDSVLNRPKRGFAPPVREWHDAICAAHGDSLTDGYLVQKGFLNRSSAARMARGDFPSGATTPLSFKALVLEQWCRQMIVRSNLN